MNGPDEPKTDLARAAPTETPGKDPPLRVAWQQAIASIRVRFVRQAVTAAGIALGIAFFTSMETLRASQPGSSPDDPNAPTRMAWYAGVSLLMCLVGVANSMLVSVTERYREIGTIKCLGASDGFVVKVFFLEAVLLGALGSIMGAALGFGVMAIALTLGGFGFDLPSALTHAGVAVLVGVGMTVLASIGPAAVAARMPAAAALRIEV